MSVGSGKIDMLDSVREDPVSHRVEGDDGFRVRAGTGQDDADMRRLGRRRRLYVRGSLGLDAPSSIQKGLSYVTGWIAALSWQSFLATPIFFAAELILTLVDMSYGSFTPKVWHATLLNMGIATFVTCFSVFGSKRLSLIEGVILFAFVLGFFAVVIPLWTIAPMVSAREAFSRDNGLPFPQWFTRVTVVNETPIPVNAMLASLLICFVIALLNLGGSEVFDSVYGLGAGAACLTYLLSIGSVLWSRTFGAPLPHARWTMGRFGVVANVIAVLYLSQFFVISFFHVYKKVTAQSMSWGIAMFGGITLIGIAITSSTATDPSRGL